MDFEKRNGETVNVIDAIGGDYMNLGIFLLNDDTGAIMAGIKTKPRDTCANIKRVIVSTWLRGEGKRPATWRTLIKILNVLKLRVLAQDISNALIDSKLAFNVDACMISEYNIMRLLFITLTFPSFRLCRLSFSCGSTIWQGRSASWTTWYATKGASLCYTTSLSVCYAFSFFIFTTGTCLADSPGLAVLVTCDYETNEQTTLKGTRVDAREMKQTFEHLNFFVHQLQNATKADIIRLLEDVSKELSSYTGPLHNKVIAFAFSGHGGRDSESEVLFANDGEKVDIMDEVVFKFVQHKAVAKIPKLFFIDACRGSDYLTKGAGDMKEKSDEQYYSKGVDRVQGNYRIDYATIPDHVSYAGDKGSIWMPKLACALRDQVDSVQNISANVKKAVQDEIEQKGGKKQQCESVSRLNCGALYLQK